MVGNFRCALAAARGQAGRCGRKFGRAGRLAASTDSVAGGGHAARYSAPAAAISGGQFGFSTCPCRGQ
jgi:hypothetical protein